MRLRNTDISVRTIGDETIVLSLSQSKYFSITGVGSRVFQLLAEERSLDQLVDTVVAEYEVDQATAHADVSAFVDRLRAADLLN